VKVRYLLLLALAWFSLSGFPSAALAQDQSQTYDPQNPGLGFRGIGARIGFVDPEDASSTVVWGAHVDAGTIVRNVHLVPYFEYWSAGAEVGGLSTDLSDLSLAVDINVDFPLQDARITPYLGGGLGVHFLNAETNVPGEESTDETKFGLNLQGGMRNQIMPNLSLFGELRYSFVSDMAQLKLLGGFTYQFLY
jgi:opacity protein-like surface antigen